MENTSYDMQIRRYRESDRPQLIQLWSRCNLVVPQNNPDKDIDRKLREQPEGLLVGENGGQLIASCMVGYDGHRGWINYLAVHPDHQRRGYARQIMNEAEKFLREKGCPKINLMVRESNTGVLGFYQELGYTRDAVISMSRRLEED